MRVLIAPDKFKGSMSAGEVAGTLAGLLEKLGHESVSLPIADGGEGTSEVLCQALGGSLVETEALDPLGRPIVTRFAVVADDLAVLEMSQASGLWRIAEGERDPWGASTFGTGQMIRSAIQQHGAKKIVIGIGGSATNDGGSGMARALGYRFLDGAGSEVEDIPGELQKAVSIDSANVIPLPEVEVACDVKNSLLGETGATRIYGPQKGIAEADFEKHENRLRHLANLASTLGSGLESREGSGAAGGLGFGLMAFCDAKLKPGFDLVADLLDLERAIANCDVVITGEGNLDQQTLDGKGPHGVARLAREQGKPVLAVVGGTDDSKEVGEAFDAILAIRPDGMMLEAAMASGSDLLRRQEVESAIETFLEGKS